MARSKQQPSNKLSVLEILSRNSAALVKRYRSQSPPQVQSTLAKISLCRTAALGARKYRCQCESVKIVYNSCGDRHCPGCSGARRSDWFESTRELILEAWITFRLSSRYQRNSQVWRLAIAENCTTCYSPLHGKRCGGRSSQNSITIPRC